MQTNRILFLLAALVVARGLAGQVADSVIALWPTGEIPCSNTHTLTEVRGDIGRLHTRVHRPELHLFRPFGPGKTDQAVIICPGGGYYLHAWDWEGTAFARALNREGITAGVLRYRLPYWEADSCRETVALSDARRAIQTLRAMAPSERIARDRIGIMGFSAGGHLAASASVHWQAGDSLATDTLDHYSSRPDFSILVYPVISMDTVGTGHAGSRRNLLGKNPSPERVLHFSLETQVDIATSPAILIHAANDEGVPARNSIDYFTALQRADVAAELHVYPDGGHGFGFGKEYPGSVANWWDRVLEWLQTQ